VEITKGDTGDRPAPPIDFMFYFIKTSVSSWLSNFFKDFHFH